MSAKKQAICDIIETLPEEFSDKILDYIEYLKFSTIINNSPQHLSIKDKEDLRNKLLEGIENTNSGKVCTVEETFNEIDELLEN